MKLKFQKKHLRVELIITHATIFWGSNNAPEVWCSFKTDIAGYIACIWTLLNRYLKGNVPMNKFWFFKTITFSSFQGQIWKSYYVFKLHYIISIDLGMLYRLWKMLKKSIPLQQIKVFKSFVMIALVLKKRCCKNCVQNNTFGKLSEACLYHI